MSPGSIPTLDCKPPILKYRLCTEKCEKERHLKYVKTYLKNLLLKLII